MRETEVPFELPRLLSKTLRSGSREEEEECGPTDAPYMLDAICICFSLGVNNKLSGGKVTLLDSFWLPPYLPLDGGMHHESCSGKC
jgi:hypothetical protein